jgi:hypothetical protein
MRLGKRAVVRVHRMLPDRRNFEPCCPVLRRYFGEARPVAITIEAGLHRRACALVMSDRIAVVNHGRLEQVAAGSALAVRHVAEILLGPVRRRTRTKVRALPSSRCFPSHPPQGWQ